MTAASSPADRAAEACTCFWTDPSTWTTHYGAVEPGSQREWNPECREHGQATLIRERLDALGPIPAPWEVWEHEGDTTVVADAGQFVAHIGNTTWPNTPLAAQLIAHAPQDLAWLLSENDRLSARVALLETTNAHAREARGKYARRLIEWREAAEQFAKERDAAKARVEELQAQLDAARADGAIDALTTARQAISDHRKGLSRNRSRVDARFQGRIQGLEEGAGVITRLLKSLRGNRSGGVSDVR